jgi:tetratricopeptide (TPR) repeat protein
LGNRSSSSIVSHANRFGRKSQIAIEYAYRFHNENPQSHVFWVYAANAARFDQAYRDIARKLKLPRIDDPDVDVCKVVLDWLNEEDSGQWLLILDNADIPGLFFRPVGSEAPNQVNPTKALIDYLPRRLNSKRSLIVTTRNRQLGEDLSNGAECIAILPFALQEARILLQSRAESIADGWNDLDCDKLLEVLGRIPLAITQAAAFMKRYRMSLRRYLGGLEKHEQNIKDYFRAELQDHTRERGFPNSVFRTWEMSFDQIREQEPRAAAILCLMAMLDRQQIPEDLLRLQGERDIDFFTAIGTLDGLSLVTKEVGKEAFAIHRLVQLSIHMWLEGRNEKARCEEEALSRLAERFPSGEYENRELCENLLPHAQAVLRYGMISEFSMIQHAKLLYNICWFDWQQGRYDPAYTNVFEAYNIRRTILGQEDSRTLNSLGLMASVLRDQGKYEEAEKMHRISLEGYEKVLGMEHPDTLVSVNNLALVLRDQGKYEAAEEMHRRALEGKEKVLGVDHPETLTSVYCLAYLLHAKGQHDRASDLYQRAISGYRKTLGSHHPTTLACSDHFTSMLNETRENPDYLARSRNNEER